MLSILHLNAYDTHGGAERLANDLMTAQRQAGHEVQMLVGRKCDPDSPALAFDPDPDLAQLPSLKAQGLPDYELRGSHRLVEHPLVRNCDVIHIHNLYGGYFNPFSLIALSQFRPVVWSIHDMQAITGYCSHALDCTRWQTGCGECPDLTRPGPELAIDSTARLWSDRQVIYRNSRLWVAGASSWILTQLRESLLGIHPLSHIPNGIRTDIFCPRDKAAARHELDIPLNVPLVGGLARGGALAHPWKGGHHARAALATLRHSFPDLMYLNLGSDGPSEETWVRHVSTTSPDQMARWLSALDVLLYPSIADTAPLAVLEALACGVPVVAFRIGGLTDQVLHGETGLLCEAGSDAALATAVATLLADTGLRERYANRARHDAEARFDITTTAAAYVDLYRSSATEFHGTEDFTAVHARDAAHDAAGMVRTQNDLLATKQKLKDLRASRKKEQGKLSSLINHRWVRAGMKLGIFPRELRNWMERLKSPPHATPTVPGQECSDKKSG